jgi:hypothetical protein
MQACSALAYGFSVASKISRLLAWGYRYLEVPLAALPEIKENTVIRKVPGPIDKDFAVMVSTGCPVPGALLPHPSQTDGQTIEAGINKRYALKPPTSCRGVHARLRNFVEKFLRANLKPLEPDTQFDPEVWLLTGTKEQRAHYPLWRATQVYQTFKLWDDRGRPMTRKVTACKGFVKDETYPEFKHARLINARPDELKGYFGPYFHAMEKAVYQLPWFIKNIPVAERAKYIRDRLYSEGCKFAATDYTAFESLFTREVMESVEFMLYDYMLSLHSDREDFMTTVRNVIGGRNVCRYRGVEVEIDATRMSGEMCTSLGNGFSNLMFMLFVCEEKGTNVVAGVVEGDDGLFALQGPLPTGDDFKALGLNIKLEIHDRLERASFCGQIFDLQDMITVTDPRPIIFGMGWTSGRYQNLRDTKLRSLARAKALSYAHQYPGCPIVQSLAHYVLRATRSLDTSWLLRGKHLGFWEREKLARDQVGKVPWKEVPVNTRILVFEQYGISPEVQIELERHFDSLSELGPIIHPLLTILVHEDWVTYWNSYVGTVRPMRFQLQESARIRV